MVSKYSNAWERLVAEKGLDGAKAVMAERRSKIKNQQGGFKDPKFASEMAKKSHLNRKKIGGSAAG